MARLAGPRRRRPRGRARRLRDQVDCAGHGRRADASPSSPWRPPAGAGRPPAGGSSRRSLGGGYWYLRNLIVAGNPLPQVDELGPISLPHPERLQEGRPDFSILHYATDTGVWRDYFAPGLHQAFGALWPLVIAAAVAGGLLPCSGAATASCAGWAPWPSSACSPTCSPR